MATKKYPSVSIIEMLEAKHVNFDFKLDEENYILFKREDIGVWQNTLVSIVEELNEEQMNSVLHICEIKLQIYDFYMKRETEKA